MKTETRTGANSAPVLVGLSINAVRVENGKEDSYERNPGGVSFVFNLSFPELFEVQENLLRLAEKFFRQPE